MLNYYIKFLKIGIKEKIMKRKQLIYLAIILLILPVIFLLNSCKKDSDEVFYSKVILKFEHKIDDSAAVFNVMKYLNEAGNHYEIKSVKWFISDLTFYKKGQTPFIVQRTTKHHYIDTGIPSTFNWEITDDIPEGVYDSFSFIFGFTPAENISYMFNNPPESAMLWPEFLGGGYHYMQLDGFWLDSVDFRRAFNFHLGIGRVIKGTDTSFVHNDFKVSFNTPITLSSNKKKEITLSMNIEEWFKNPHTWDFNFWGPAIMDNEAAMKTVKENGEVGVFKITSIKDI
jgi:hypothetical protein